MTHKMPSVLLTCIVFIYCFCTYHSTFADVTTLQLASTYNDKKNIQLKNYWVSEKYDGVRAYWNGKQLLTRGGHPIMLPTVLSDLLPAAPLDGELWAGRQNFEFMSGLARQHSSKLNDWKGVHFMMFDLPAHKGIFKERYKVLNMLYQNQPTQSFWRVVNQQPVASEAILLNRLKQIELVGAEGLMLKNIHSQYSAGRSQDLIKVKSYQDTEATVIGYKPGKGKFEGMMGSLKVRTQKGIEFYIGSGFTQQQRKTPPKIGTIITFKYYGLTRKGTPRFASFMRVKTP